MASIFAHRSLGLGLLLPGYSEREEDKYFLRPPFSIGQSYDGVVADTESSGVILSNDQGSDFILTTARQTTVSYGDGGYAVTYFYDLLQGSTNNHQQLVRAVQITDAKGARVLDITPNFAPNGDSPLLTLELESGRILDESGNFAGLLGTIDIWQIIFANALTVSGSGQADVIQISNSYRNFIDGQGGNDTLVGGPGEDHLSGGDGVDYLDGGDGGEDTVSYSYLGASDTVYLALAGATAATVVVNGIADDLVRNFEDACGGMGDDTLVGDAGGNYLTGIRGNDTLSGGAGMDGFDGGSGLDRLDGGAGFDYAEYYFEVQPVRVMLAGSAHTTVFLDGVADDTILNIEGIGGGTFDDTLTGDSSANVLRGSGGNDTLAGGGGNDTLLGGGGGASFGEADTLIGGAGIDTASWGIYENSFITNFSGLNFGQKLVVSLNGANSAAVLIDGFLAGTVTSVENLVGADGKDTFTGDALANRLDGGRGNDRLVGGAGPDVLIGGEGNDFLNGGSGTDTADYSARAFLGSTRGISVRLSGSTQATLSVHQKLPETDTLVNIENVIGSGNSDILRGDPLANTLSGGGGNDYLQGFGGLDVLNGGAGIDTASFEDKTLPVVVALNGVALVTATVGGATDDSLANIENLDGGAGDDTLTGDARSNTLYGLIGNDTLSGGNGSDLLSGGGGLDVLDGGAGFDRVSFISEAAAVVVTLDAANAAQVREGGLSTDILRNVEGVLGGSGDDILTGDQLGNHLEGRDGADILNGRLGSDTLLGGIDLFSDFFVFDTALGPNNVDSVSQFFAGTDKIVLDDDIFTRLTGTLLGVGLSAENFVSDYEARALDADDHLIFDYDSGTLSYDADGSGAGAAIVFARVGVIPDQGSSEPWKLLAATDFLVIA